MIDQLNRILECKALIINSNGKIPMERYFQIREELRELDKKRAKSEILDEEYDKRRQFSIEEVNQADFYFRSEEEFEFVMKSIFKPEVVSQRIKHEKEHARHFESKGATCKFGIHRFLGPDGRPSFIPFVVPDFDNLNLNEIDIVKIKIENLESVSELSPQDKLQLEHLKFLKYIEKH